MPIIKILNEENRIECSGDTIAVRKIDYEC
jgi:hypothetical protein